ncbi:MAG TPA: molybdenum cofactor guanylyltransferase, partial [Geobacterales bacterium]|nr:molybdenum cofactor guanylyltransferase [Geobacterales bacterium]
VVTNEPELFDFLPCRKVADIYPGAGPLAGIHAALHHARTDLVFITACDMPRLNGELIRYLALRGDPEGVVVPEGAKGVEPLHAVYGKGCLSAVDETLAQGERRVAAMYLRSRLTTVGQEELAPFDPTFTSFTNINTPEEYYSLRGTTLPEGTGERGTE